MDANSRMKSGKRPGESRERNTAIHHRIFLDIRKVIQSDEVMPDHLRINPKRDYHKAEQDENVGSPECCGSACVSSAIERTRRGELAFARANKGIFLPGCTDSRSSGFCAVRLVMPFGETIR